MTPLMPESPFDAETIVRELSATLALVDRPDIRVLVEKIAAAPRIFVAGAGRTGLVMRCFAMRLMQLGLAVHVVGDATTPAITAGDLLVSGSGSGEIRSLAEICGLAGKAGAAVALVTASPTSSCAKLADPVVTIPASSSPQPLGNLFEQALLILLDAVATELMRLSGQSAADLAKRHANLE